MIGRFDVRTFLASRLLSLARALSLALALALASSLAACSPPAPTDHAGHGRAIDVDREARTITLDHGDIPGLMKGMTMTFAVAPGVDLEKVEKGAVVDFRVKSEGSAVTVIGITPAPASGSTAPATP